MVGHIPREISSHVYYFITAEGGTVSGTVTNLYDYDFDGRRPDEDDSGEEEVGILIDETRNIENEAEDNNSNAGETEFGESEFFEDFVMESLKDQHAADDEEDEDEVSDGDDVINFSCSEGEGEGVKFPCKILQNSHNL